MLFLRKYTKYRMRYLQFTQKLACCHIAIAIASKLEFIAQFYVY